MSSPCACGRQPGPDETLCPSCGRVLGPPPAVAPPRPGPSRLALALVAAALLVAVGVGGFTATVRLAGTSPESRRAYLPTLPPTPDVAPTPQSLADVAASAQTRVVTIEVQTDRGERFGTGWLLDGRGDFVTNNHVIATARGVRLVDRGGAVHPGTVMGVDAVQDVAVVRADDGFSARPLPTAPSADILLGAEVVVLASSRATMHADVTDETVSRLHQSITVKPDPDAADSSVVEYTDMIVLRGASVFQGNSGGPVLDDLGRVIGIVTASSETVPQAYAIPVGRVLEELRAFAARSAPA